MNYAQPGSTAIGSIILNHFVGGLNPFAVEVALALGARVVWLPSIHAANHLHHYGGATYSAMASSLTSRPIEGISLLDASGDIRPEVIHILGLVRDAGAILATGHISPNETRKVVAAAVELHLERVIVTHPDFEVPPFDVESQAELANQGAYLELTGLNHRTEWGGLSHAVVVEHVRRIGAERFVLASDFGQQASGPPWQGFANEVVKLLA